MGHDQLYGFTLSLHTYCMFSIPLGNSREEDNQQASAWMRGMHSFIILSFKIPVLLLRDFMQPRPCLLKPHSVAPLGFLLEWSLLNFPLTRVRRPFLIVLSLYWINITISFPHQLPELIAKGTSHILEIEKPRHSVRHNLVCGIFANTRSQL